MLTALIAAATLQTQKLPETMCPLMNNRPTTGRMAVDYGSDRIFVCCETCIKRFTRSATKTIKDAISRKILIGHSLFDPISQTRLDAKKAAVTTTHNAFIIPFASESNLKEFNALSEQARKAPTKECLTCPACGDKMERPEKAHAYDDQNGVRFYYSSAKCFADRHLIDFQPSPETVSSLKPRPVPLF